MKYEIAYSLTPFHQIIQILSCSVKANPLRIKRRTKGQNNRLETCRRRNTIQCVFTIYKGTTHTVNYANFPHMLSERQEKKMTCKCAILSQVQFQWQTFSTAVTHFIIQ